MPLKCVGPAIPSLLLWSLSPGPISTPVLDGQPSKTGSGNPLFRCCRLPQNLLLSPSYLWGAPSRCFQSPALLGPRAPGTPDNSACVREERVLRRTFSGLEIGALTKSERSYPLTHSAGTPWRRHVLWSPSEAMPSSCPRPPRYWITYGSKNE